MSKMEKPFKAITIPIKSENDYQNLMNAAGFANMKHTSFMIKAIKDAVKKEIEKEKRQVKKTSEARKVEAACCGKQAASHRTGSDERFTRK